MIGDVVSPLDVSPLKGKLGGFREIALETFSDWLKWTINRIMSFWHKILVFFHRPQHLQVKCFRESNLLKVPTHPLLTRSRIKYENRHANLLYTNISYLSFKSITVTVAKKCRKRNPKRYGNEALHPWMDVSVRRRSLSYHQFTDSAQRNVVHSSLTWTRFFARDGAWNQANTVKSERNCVGFCQNLIGVKLMGLYLDNACIRSLWANLSNVLTVFLKYSYKVLDFDFILVLCWFSLLSGLVKGITSSCHTIWYKSFPVPVWFYWGWVHPFWSNSVKSLA